MSDRVTMTVAEAEAFAIAALISCGTSKASARALAEGIIGAELDGIKSHGFAYLPIYCEHVLCGKVDGSAQPKIEELSDMAFLVDAGHGFAHPAIVLGFEAAIPAAKEYAAAAIGIRNSYNCGVLGFHAERGARAGFLTIGFTNAPASIAAVGGTEAVVGTNPFACAVPDGSGGLAMVIDQSSSVVAKSEISVRVAKGERIPEGWAFGPDRKPTTDPAIGLKGTMAPSGGHKGVGQALLVELFSAVLTGATLGLDASSFATPEGGPPGTGQFFMLFDTEVFSGGTFVHRVKRLVGAIDRQEGAHVPGQRRFASRERVYKEGITISRDLYDRVRSYVE